jgi:heterodisulfide reductase subunit A-like polyferredoxin
LNPPEQNLELAEKFGIELNSHGFCQATHTNPIETTRPGIFVSGAFQGPTDIPESVFTASGAGAQVGEFLDYRRDKLAKEGSIRRNGMSPRKNRKSASSCVTAAPISQRGGCSVHR